MPSTIVDLSTIDLPPVVDEDRPVWSAGEIELEEGRIGLRFVGVTGCQEKGIGENVVDLEVVKMAITAIPLRMLRRGIKAILK